MHNLNVTLPIYVFKMLIGLLLLYPIVSRASNVQFFDRPDFQGYIQEEISKPSCTNMPQQFQNFSGSIKTTGCIIVNPLKSCKKIGFLIKSELSKFSVPRDEYNSTGKEHFFVNSFIDCTKSQNQDEVDVDIYFTKIYTPKWQNDQYQSCLKGLGVYQHASESWKKEICGTQFSERDCRFQFGVENKCHIREEKIIARFTDMCGCKTLPKILNGKSISADVHGNCLKVYKTNNCEGQAWKKYGDYDTTPFVIDHVNGLNDILSIEPCVVPVHCTRVNLTATIFKVEVPSDVLSIQQTTKDITLKGKQVFINNGTSEQEESYEVTKETMETAHSETTQSFSEISTTSISGTLEVGAEFAGISAKISTTLSSGFESQSGSGTSRTSTVSDRRDIKVSKKIVVPPCTIQEVTAILKMAEGAEVNYKILMKIHGEFWSGEKMTGKDIAARLKNITVVENLDEYTVVTEMDAKLKTSYGLDIVTQLHSVPIKECMDSMAGSRGNLMQMTYDTIAFANLLIVCFSKMRV